MTQAVATRDTWSGITLNWPVDGGGRLPVELSGLPIYDRARNFAGYRGFGVCRDLDGLARLAALRRYEFFSDARAWRSRCRPISSQPEPDRRELPSSPPRRAADRAAETAAHPDHRTALQPELPDADRTARLHTKPIRKRQWKRSDGNRPGNRNVVPFRPLGEPKSPTLTPVENSAFNELARQLSARLENENGATSPRPPPPHR